MAAARLTDECLWLKHIEPGTIRDALSSLHPGSIISLTVDGDRIDFQRMAMGRDGRATLGLLPTGPNKTLWRARYVAGRHLDIQLDFAGGSDA